MHSPSAVQNYSMQKERLYHFPIPHHRTSSLDSDKLPGSTPSMSLLTIDAMAVYTGNPKIRSKVHSVPMEREVAITIPSTKEQNPRETYVAVIWSSSNLVDVMHPDLITDVLRNPNLFI